MTLNSKGTVVIVGNGVVLDSGVVQVFTDSLVVVKRVRELVGLYDLVAEENPPGFYIVTAKINPLFASTEAEIAELTDNINQAAYLDANLAIEIAVSEEASELYAGGPATFAVTVTNNGPHAASAVVVTATIPSGLTLVNPDGATVPAGTTYNSGTGAWAIPTLAIGASKTLTLACTIGTDQGENDIDFDVTADSAQSDLSAGDNAATATITVLEAADLSMTLAANNETPIQGATVQFTVTVANAGPDIAELVTGSFPVPAGMGYAAKNVPAGTTYNEATGAFTIASIAAAANAVFTVDLTVGPATTGTVNCAAEITGLTQVDPDDSNDSDSVALAIPVADLSVVLTSDIATVAQSGDVLFTVTIANAGPAQSTGITGTLPIPSGFVYKAKGVGAGQTFDENTGAFTINAINASANTNFTTTWTAAAEQVEDITVIATITGSNQGDPVGDNVSSVVISIAEADLALALVPDDDTPAKGGNVVFTVLVTNNGPDAATGITGTFVLPEKLTYNAKSVDAGETYDENTGNWTIDSIAANASKMFTVTAVVAVDAPAAVVCEAEITGSNQIDAVAGNDTASVTLSPHA